jgi:hypothetical protein
MEDPFTHTTAREPGRRATVRRQQHRNLRQSGARNHAVLGQGVVFIAAEPLVASRPSTTVRAP